MALQVLPAITPTWAAEITVTPTSAATNLSVQNIIYSAARPEQQFVFESPVEWLSAGFAVMGIKCTSATNLAITYLNLTGSGYQAAAAPVRIVAL